MYFNVESIFMAIMPILLLLDYSIVKKWLVYQVSGYLLFRILFMNTLFIFPGLYWLNQSLWVERLIGVVMLLILVVNRKK